jgi:DNA repair protein RadC
MQTYAPRLRELTLTYRVRRSIAGDEIRFGGCVTDADEAARLLIAILADEPSEVFGMLCVTPRHRIIGYHEVSRGPLNALAVQPRDVFRVAILANAAGVILAHSRRSGDATPNDDDIAIARNLACAAHVIGVPVLDYVVIAGDRHVSVRETGLMPIDFPD